MFHILPDDTGASAIWVAQRVPSDHITAVANQFVIGEIDLSDKTNFLGSSNVLTVAAANGLWQPDVTPFHFAKIYGLDIGPQAMMCTRRVWRVFTLAAPSLLPKFSPFTDSWGTFGYGEHGTEAYPFSIKPDVPLKVKDFMTMNRDQYENTLFDMTANVGKSGDIHRTHLIRIYLRTEDRSDFVSADAGPFGDPIRYRALTTDIDPENGVEAAEVTAGTILLRVRHCSDVIAGRMYERPISLWRTSYSTITQSRSWLPNVIGARELLPRCCIRVLRFAYNFFGSHLDCTV
jgi:dipeptidase